MYNEVLPGFYLCKYEAGIAHYLVAKNPYDIIHTQANGQSAHLNAVGMSSVMVLRHLLHNTAYEVPFHKIKLLNWEDMPLNYQKDAVASNENIRRKYHESIYGAQNNEMSQDLKDKLFSLVDKTTGQLRYLVPKGTATFAHGLITYDVEEVPKPMVSNNPCAEIPLNRPVVHVPILDDRSGSMRGYPDVQVEVARQLIGNNNTNNSSMNFNNIPGLALNFGKLESGRLAVSLGGEVAFKSKDGGYITIQNDGVEKTRVEVGDLKFDIDFYKLPTQELEVGDIILLDNEFRVITENKNGNTKFINPLTGAVSNALKRDNVLGMYFYTKIVSLFDMAGGKGIGLGGLDPMTLMLLTQGTGNNVAGSTSGGMDLGMMLLMSQLGGTKGGDMSSMLPLMMLGSGGKDMNSMLPFLLMGNKGGGGLGNLFGKKKIAPKSIVRKAPAKKIVAKKTVAKG